MLMMKKRNLVFVIIVSVLVGALTLSGVTFLIGQASGGYRTITNEEYENYKQIKDKYGKLVELENIKERYVPVDRK